MFYQGSNHVFPLFKIQIERLRKEGSKLLEEEQERLKEEIREGQTRLQQQDETENDNSVSETPKLKVSNIKGVFYEKI